ncbi:hypothetical protein GGF32_010083 [Allomyces javanicus]|nr:hypothetical protein GGF32_010083 [Allomyces javanicus]
MRPSGTVAARSAHFENLTANAHVYRGASHYDRSWSRRVRKHALYEIRNQIAWLLQHGQKGLTTHELDDGNFMRPPVSEQDGPIVPPPLMPTPRTSNECESRPTTARTLVKKRRRHEDADEDDADDSPVPCKRRRTRRAVAFRRR